jgi:hypothetical protein
MEFIDGDDLSSLLRRIGRLPSDKAIEISRQLCFGLAAIHEAGIFQRHFPVGQAFETNRIERVASGQRHGNFFCRSIF